ncbi:hypothetical protein SAMN02949497_4197 [Methylomagnum ishizawai]|uniref:Uncharacterized protein n=1 Tax=Methylomagnum ishizawai TaxID=1760988 RepID=A0A1Y6D1I0_9GAMM|nr:hypothetical protein [Methylomagnum ishizawai]SMF96789.1 hypothetical protein SAMN02949497_4197 [Methylomagnum ishizawai]
MPHFLGAWFDPAQSPDAILLEQVRAAAIERAVDKTDPRLRALDHYRERLHTPVARALSHVIGLVDRLPAPVEISPGQYGHDPRLKTLFASAEHLGEVLGRFQGVREYLAQRPGPAPDDIYGLLATAKREKQILGMALEDGLVRRDVLQTAISFEDHQYFAPSDSEAAARAALTTLAFDFLLLQARQAIAAHKTRRGELTRQRQRLRRRLLSPDADPAAVAGLEADIAAIDEELGCFSGIELGLEDSLRHVESLLGEAERWLTVQPFRMSLDYRNVQTTVSEVLEMSEAAALDGTRRIVLFGRIPRRQLPEPKDMLKLGRAYLGT